MRTFPLGPILHLMFDYLDSGREQPLPQGTGRLAARADGQDGRGSGGYWVWAIEREQE